MILAKDLTDFGIFYPRGHIVAVFGRRAEGARKNLQDHTGFLATLSKSDEAVAKHLEAAEQGPPSSSSTPRATSKATAP